jgi:hypothetical protein
MTGWVDRLRAAVRRPLPLACNPLYRFYQGGSLTRQFRGLPERPDDFWSEDWVVQDDVLPFFDVTALEVEDDIEVSDGRFSIAVVVSGSGSAEGDFGRQPLRRGETYALPASLALRVRAGPEGPVRVIRCLGPEGRADDRRNA